MFVNPSYSNLKAQLLKLTSYSIPIYLFLSNTLEHILSCLFVINLISSWTAFSCLSLSGEEKIVVKSKASFLLTPKSHHKYMERSKYYQNNAKTWRVLLLKTFSQTPQPNFLRDRECLLMVSLSQFFLIHYFPHSCQTLS